jgi:hypothetical protein
VNQVVFSTLQRLGSERMKKVSNNGALKHGILSVHDKEHCSNQDQLNAGKQWSNVCSCL